MKEFLVRIPTAGFIEQRVLLPESTTDDQAINLVIHQFNATAQTTVAKKAMVVGSIIDFPLLYAEVVK